jgi:hypothetical protein
MSDDLVGVEVCWLPPKVILPPEMRVEKVDGQAMEVVLSNPYGVRVVLPLAKSVDFEWWHAQGVGSSVSLAVADLAEDPKCDECGRLLNAEKRHGHGQHCSRWNGAGVP